MVSAEPASTAIPARAFYRTAEGHVDWHYVGLLLYTCYFYLRLSERIPVFGAMRLELALGAVLVAGSLARIARGWEDFRADRLNRAALAFIAVALLTVPFAYVRSRALDQFVSMIKFFVIYLMIVTSIDTERKLKGFLAVYLSLIGLIFVEPFVLSLAGRGFIFNNHMWRLAGTTNYFGHPNQLGGITAEHIPFYYYLARRSRGLPAKCVFYGLIAIALRVVMLTQSRTGFLGVLACVFFIWLLSKSKARGVALAAVLMVGVWVAAPPQTRARIETFFKLDKVLSTERSDFDQEELHELGSMNSRLDLIKKGLVAFSERPILGWGLQNFISFNGHRYGHWFPPHNTFIQALAEMGLVGTVAFLWVLKSILGNLAAARRALEGEGEEPFLASLNRAVFVYLWARIVVSLFGQDLYANYWWVAAGFSQALLQVAGARLQPGSRIGAAGSEAVS